ncbi:hypothetical protein MXB_2298 [Myxobolus squamalis]|nr:hypothetical protein MXB_2298 [Myxobolus squamalis]
MYCTISHELVQALHRKLKKLYPNQPKIYDLLKYVELLAIVPIDKIHQAMEIILLKHGLKNLFKTMDYPPIRR